MDIHNIQRFTIISQPFSEFWLVAPLWWPVGPLRLKHLLTPLVGGDCCPVHQPFVTNLTAAEIKLTEMQKIWL